MRRRAQSSTVSPPARLLVFEWSEWLPLVDDSEYDPDHYRNRNPDGLYGPPTFSLENWRRQRACELWSEARHAWYKEHGWPGGWTSVDLYRDEVAARRAAYGVRREGFGWRRVAAPQPPRDGR